MATSNNAFGKKIKFLRTSRHWTQNDLFDHSGVSQGELSRIENGNFRELNIDTIKSLADAFEVSAEILVRGTTFAQLFGQSDVLAVGRPYEGDPFTCYFASALTNLTDKQLREIEALDQKVHEILANYQSYPILLYRPRLNTSPKFNPEVSARQVYDIDQGRVTTADLIILAALFPSLGAGMELQLALQSCSSIILLVKEGQPLSRMVEGCPARKVIIRYKNLPDLESKLVEVLNELLPVLAEFRFSQLEPNKEKLDLELGERIRLLREQRGMDQATLARMIGVDSACIQSLESKPEQISNPSLRLLRRIARALGAAESYIISGYDVPIHQKIPIFNEHLEALRSLSREINMPADDYTKLWKDHVEQYQYVLSAPGVDRRTDIGDKKYWSKRYEQFKRSKGENRKLF
jgi:transcriptional regulator with XRE-family HTH domain